MKILRKKEHCPVYKQITNLEGGFFYFLTNVVKEGELRVDYLFCLSKEAENEKDMSSTDGVFAHFYIFGNHGFDGCV